MQLNELFDKGHDFDIVTNTGRNWKAVAMVTTDDGELEVVVSAWSKKLRVWHVGFSVDGSVDMTGRGNQFKVFAAVSSMLKKLVERKNPSVVTMTAKEDSRAKLYMRMLERSGLFHRIVSFDLTDSLGYHAISTCRGGFAKLFPMYDRIPSDEYHCDIELGIDMDISVIVDDNGYEISEDAELLPGFVDKLKPEIDFLIGQYEKNRKGK